MDVVIDELSSRIDVVDSGALLASPTLERIIRSVLAALAAQQQTHAALKSDLDLRSVVEQQRGATGGRE